MILKIDNVVMTARLLKMSAFIVSIIIIFLPKSILLQDHILQGTVYGGTFILDSLVLEALCEITTTLQVLDKPQKNCAHYLNRFHPLNCVFTSY